MANEFHFASISHELRSAIANISNLSTQMLFKSEVDIEGLSKIKASSEMLLRILDGVLNEDANLEERIISIEVILEECFSIERKRAIDFLIYIDPEIPFELLCYDAILIRVLRNLIDNVYTHSQATKCEIEISIEENELRFQITDNGKGLDENSRNNLFSPISQSLPGHGIGLFLSALIVQKIGGQLKCENPSSGNCTFVLLVPFKKYVQNRNLNKVLHTQFEDEKTSAFFVDIALRLGLELEEGSKHPILKGSLDTALTYHDESSNDSPVILRAFPYFRELRDVLSEPKCKSDTQNGSKLWLIVEDDIVVTQVTSLMLRSKEISHITAKSGEACLEKLQQAPDIILMDFYLSGESGDELAKIIKGKGYEGLIVGLSADSVALESSNYFDLCLLKPISIAQIERILAHQNSLGLKL